MRSSSSSDANFIANCGCIILILLVNFIVGTWSVNYLLLEFAGKTIPTIGAFVIGLFAGEITVPAAIIVWILKAFGAL